MKSPGEQQCDGQNQRGWQVWDAYFIIHQHNLYHIIFIIYNRLQVRINILPDKI